MNSLLTLACIAISFGAQATSVETSTALGRDTNHAAQSSASNTWWDEFNAPALSNLQRAARARAAEPAYAMLHPDVAIRNAPSLGVRLALAYVEVVTLDARLALVDDMHSTFFRQRELAAAASPNRVTGQLIEILDHRQAGIERITAQLRAQRAALVEVIAGLCGMSIDQVQSALPRGDDDQAASYLAGLLPNDLPNWGKAALEPDENSRPDVVRALQTVLALRSEATTLKESVQGRRLAADVAARRWHLGTAVENDALEARQHLLVDQEMLAMVQAQLASAWIALRVCVSDASTLDGRGAASSGNGSPP